jgi:peptidoglycan/LPS O-acetylase OafA/YrhL
VDYKQLAAGLFYYTNYFIIFSDSYEQQFTILNILWSLSIEEHFYIFYPLIFSSLYQRKRVLIILLFGVLIICLLFRTYYTKIYEIKDIANSVIYYSTHTRIDSIVFGCLAALMYPKIKLKLNSIYLFFTVSIFLILISLLFRNWYFRETFRFSIQGVALFLLLFSLLGSNHLVSFKNILDSKYLILIGKLSYSLYLFHWFAIKVSNQYYSPFSTKWYFLFFFITVLFSIISYYIIEKYFIKYRKYFGSAVI